MRKRTPAKSRIVVSLFLSLLVHLFGLWLVHVLLFEEAKQQLFRARLPSFISQSPERFQIRPSIPVSRGLIERLQAAGPTQSLDIEWEEGSPGELPTIEAPSLDADLPTLAGEKGEWVAPADSLPDAILRELEQFTEVPLAMDLVALDAEVRKRTIVLVDPETGKLKQAWLHLPVYTRAEGGCQGCPPSVANKRIGAPLERIPRGSDLPAPVPVISRVHTFPLGPKIMLPEIAYMPIEGFPLPDPIHAYPLFPRRHLLHPTEMSQYPVIDLSQIDVESTDVMVDYLITGGFGLVGRGQLSLLSAALRIRVGDQLQQISIDLDHPLFDAYFPIERYQKQPHCCKYASGDRVSAGCRKWCPAFGPLTGLQLDDRLVALTGVPAYTTDCDCLANQLYVNVLAFALAQPSQMGGRYLVRD